MAAELRHPCRKRLPSSFHAGFACIIPSLAIVFRFDQGRRRPLKPLGGLLLCKSIVGCDENGVWRENHPGARAYIPWDGIVSVAVVKYDRKTHVETVLEFGQMTGPILECHDSSDCYDSLIAVVGQRFALAADWYSSVHDLPVAGSESDSDGFSHAADSLLVWESADFKAFRKRLGDG